MRTHLERQAYKFTTFVDTDGDISILRVFPISCFLFLSFSMKGKFSVEKTPSQKQSNILLTVVESCRKQT